MLYTINFRVFSEHHNKMFFFNLQDLPGIVQSGIVPIEIAALIVRKEELLMLDTTFKDNEGTPIYTGDIVKGFVPDSKKDEYFSYGVVSIKNGSYCILDRLGEYIGDLHKCVINTSVKVIGNLFDLGEEIQDDQDYKNCLKVAERLILRDPKPDSENGVKLKHLAGIIKTYEDINIVKSPNP